MKQNEYFEDVSTLLLSQAGGLIPIIETLYECISRRSNIWIIGNGGSASTADHFEVDLSFVRINDNSMEVRAKSLCSNNAVITAIGNDIGFEKIFAHQLMRQASKEDVCFMISASGNSQNLVQAMEVCKQKSVTTIAILGFDGGQLKSQADFVFLVESKLGLYGQVEDVHLSVCHFLAAELKKRIFVGA